VSPWAAPAFEGPHPYTRAMWLASPSAHTAPIESLETVMPEDEQSTKSLRNAADLAERQLESAFSF